MASLKPCILGFLSGMRDSVLGLSMLATIDSINGKVEDENLLKKKTIPRSGANKKAKILPMIAQCCFLNGGVLLVSVLIFERYLVPAVRWILAYLILLLMKNNQFQSSLWSWVEPAMSYTFKYFWVFPLFWLCKILNCFWFVEISDNAYRKKYGRPLSSILSSSKNESMLKILSKTMADFIFSMKVEVLFLIQAQIVGLVPVVGPILTILHMSLLYSLYAFEYTWMNLGWTVDKRLSYVENNWSYFLGFGMLLTGLTSVSTSPVINACIFGITFPLFILSGLDAKPYEKCDLPLRLFSLVIWITNKIFLRSGGKRTSSSSSARTFDTNTRLN